MPFPLISTSTGAGTDSSPHPTTVLRRAAARSLMAEAFIPTNNKSDQMKQSLVAAYSQIQMCSIHFILIGFQSTSYSFTKTLIINPLSSSTLNPFSTEPVLCLFSAFRQSLFSSISVCAHAVFMTPNGGLFCPGQFELFLFILQDNARVSGYLQIQILKLSVKQLSTKCRISRIQSLLENLILIFLLL